MPPPAKTKRLPYATMGVALALILIVGWFLDGSGGLFDSIPHPKRIYGTWILDQQILAQQRAQAQKDFPDVPMALVLIDQIAKNFGDIVLTFAPGACTIAAPGLSSVDGPCDYSGIPTRIITITIPGRSGPPFYFVLDDQDPQRMVWNGLNTQIPLLRRE